MKTQRMFVACAVLLVTLAGCKGTTPIKEILDDPSRFGSETVRIQGDVTESVGVLGTGAYQVDDGTGTITVVSQSGGVPRQGAKVGVEGTVRPAFTLGSQTLTVLMESKRVAP
jgi:hypothetical protein